MLRRFPSVGGLILVLLCGLSVSCALTPLQTHRADPKDLAARASWDLMCPIEQLQAFPLRGRTMAVRGCGQQASYVELCVMRSQAVSDCHWVK